MRIWGIGAKWGDKNMYGVFAGKESQGYAAIGWSPDEAPDLDKMFHSIREGDAIYIKRFLPNGRRLFIIAIGIVTKSAHIDHAVIHQLYNSDENGQRSIISVDWRWLNNEPDELTLNDLRTKNNVYSNTLYEEYHPAILTMLRMKVPTL